MLQVICSVIVRHSKRHCPLVEMIRALTEKRFVFQCKRKIEIVRHTEFSFFFPNYKTCSYRIKFSFLCSMLATIVLSLFKFKNRLWKEIKIANKIGGDWHELKMEDQTSKRVFKAHRMQNKYLSYCVTTSHCIGQPDRDR